MKITIQNQEVELTQEQMKAIAEEYTKKSENKPKFFKPKCHEDTCFFINEYLEVDSAEWGVIPYYWDSKLLIGNIHRTPEEAQKALDRQKSLVRLWDVADSKFYFRPDWSNREQRKYYITYNFNKKCFYTDSSFALKMNFTLPYFESEEDVEAFIKECEEDLKIYCLDQ